MYRPGALITAKFENNSSQKSFLREKTKSFTGFACKIRLQIKIERIMQNQFLKLNI